MRIFFINFTMLFLEIQDTQNYEQMVAFFKRDIYNQEKKVYDIV